MPVENQWPYESYTASGNTDTFNVPFRFDKGEDLLVKVAGIEKLLTADYTVTGGEPSGDIIFNPGKLPVYGAKVEIQRNMPIARETDYTSTPFREAIINGDLDKLTMLLQQLALGVNAGLRFPHDEAPIKYLPEASNRAGLLLGFDANGDPVAVAMGGSADLVVPVDATGGDTYLDILAANNPAAKTMVIIKSDATANSALIRPEAGTICRDPTIALTVQDEFIRITPNAAQNNWMRIG